MSPFANKKVIVVGLDPSGVAACALLKRNGARVSAIPAGKQTSQNEASDAKALGVAEASAETLAGGCELAVLSSRVSRKHPGAEKLAREGVPLISDLEL